MARVKLIVKALQHREGAGYVLRKKGETFEVPDETAARWVSEGIVELEGGREAAPAAKGNTKGEEKPAPE